ncbi:AraC family transcriptional regulator [Paenibacillus spongiae]|uniref:AraC family transcriptional regulator n=1 Tax=Paenibacillus spongiae TaxID=2909671 RepID=A0ABY5S7I1_9BACL|nr:AraC family transcriptional regulator [Paenibacillus spongiae]UVI28782.1 AraC family transcriptional regulator [Paenibacillus spongiae]
MLDITGVYHDVNPTWNIGKGSGCDTLVYVSEGKVVFWVNNDRFELEKGEALYVPYGVDRAWSSHPEELHQKYTVQFNWEDRSRDNPLHFTKQDAMIRIKPRNAPYFEQRFATLFFQWSGQRPYFELMSQHIFLELLTLIAQERKELRASPSKERIARNIQEYILCNFRKNITIEELASLAEITPNYTTVLFKEVLGSTPIQYLHQIRIKTAVNLLENTQMTVREIAEYLGYCDQAYFNRIFKKWMGAAPSHIR